MIPSRCKSAPASAAALVCAMTHRCRPPEERLPPHLVHLVRPASLHLCLRRLCRCRGAHSARPPGSHPRRRRSLSSRSHSRGRGAAAIAPVSVSAGDDAGLDVAAAGPACAWEQPPWSATRRSARYTPAARPRSRQRSQPRRCSAGCRPLRCRGIAVRGIQHSCCRRRCCRGRLGRRSGRRQGRRSVSAPPAGPPSCGRQPSRGAEAAAGGTATAGAAAGGRQRSGG